MFSQTYYGLIINDLTPLVNVQGEWAKQRRRMLYEFVREQSGLEFEDYGDEPERWLAWLHAHDTTDKQKAFKIRDENIRRREGAKDKQKQR